MKGRRGRWAPVRSRTWPLKWGCSSRTSLRLCPTADPNHRNQNPDRKQFTETGNSFTGSVTTCSYFNPTNGRWRLVVPERRWGRTEGRARSAVPRRCPRTGPRLQPAGVGGCGGRTRWSVWSEDGNKTPSRCPGQCAPERTTQ